MDLTIYFEIFVLLDVLFGNVFRDHLVRHIPRATAEISPCPQMPAPELFLQVRILRQQLMRGVSFQPLHQPADRHLRWDRYQKVNMVLCHVPLHYLYVVLTANVTDQIPRSRRYFSR